MKTKRIVCLLLLILFFLKPALVEAMFPREGEEKKKNETPSSQTSSNTTKARNESVKKSALFTGYQSSSDEDDGSGSPVAKVSSTDFSSEEEAEPTLAEPPHRAAAAYADSNSDEDEKVPAVERLIAPGAKTPFVSTPTGKAKKISYASRTSRAAEPKKLFPEVETRIEEITTGVDKVDVAAESDASPDSSDSEYGAKTLMRKVIKFVGGTEDRGYFITKRTKQPRTTQKAYQVITPVVTEEEVPALEIKEHPDRYYIANFSGEYLGYIKNNEGRRKYVKQAIDKTCDRSPPSYSSIARRSIEQKGLSPAEVQEKMDELDSPALVQNPKDFVGGYVTKTHSAKKIKKVSPTYGNPVISTSKDPDITTYYSDHPEEASAGLLPRYSNENKKPKHRLIGLTTVIVHEANKYLSRPKADVEKLRTEGEVGQMGLRDLNNQEVIFADSIQSEDIAGYVPLIYPNMSKMKKATTGSNKGRTQYTSNEKGLFGLEENAAWRLTQREPLSLSSETKENTLYRLNRRLQWRMAEKYVKDRNPDGELIWVDHEGRLRRFRVNQQAKAEPKAEAKAVAEEPEESGGAMFDIGDMDIGDMDSILDPPHGGALPQNTLYISPAIALADNGNQLRIALGTRFMDDLTKTQAVIAIHTDAHFVGIHIRRNEDNSYSLLYFDPTVSSDTRQPLHPIPADVQGVLEEFFPNEPIVEAGSLIQTYTHLQDGSIQTDNNHCGFFVAYMMTGLARGFIRINPDGSNRLQGTRSGTAEWQNIQDLTKEQSDAFGRELRKVMADFVKTGAPFFP